MQYLAEADVRKVTKLSSQSYRSGKLCFAENLLIGLVEVMAGKIYLYQTNQCNVILGHASKIAMMT